MWGGTSSLKVLSDLARSDEHEVTPRSANKGLDDCETLSPLQAIQWKPCLLQCAVPQWLVRSFHSLGV